MQNDQRKHKIRFISHSITAGLLCIAAFIWAPKSMVLAYAILGSAGIYAFAARRELHLSEPKPTPQSSRPALRAVPAIKFDRDIFRT